MPAQPQQSDTRSSRQLVEPPRVQGIKQGVGVCTYFLQFNLYLATSQHTMLFENISVDYFIARAQFKLPPMLFFSVYRYFVCPLTHGARSHLVFHYLFCCCPIIQIHCCVSADTFKYGATACNC